MFEHTPIHSFEIGPLRIYVWGLMFAIAFTLSSYLAIRNAKGLDKEKLYSSLVYIILLGLIGARLSYILAYPYYFASFVDMLQIWDGGLTFLGGFIGGLLGFFIFSKVHKINFWKYADALAPYVALGLAITRVGCFLNWCCYGSPTTLPWAVCVDGSCVHPTQIYHLIADVFIFLILTNKKTNKNKFDGKIFALFLILYAVFRFAIDFLRAYDYKIVLSVSQWTMILVFAVGLFIYFKKSKALNKEKQKNKFKLKNKELK